MRKYDEEMNHHHVMAQGFSSFPCEVPSSQHQYQYQSAINYTFIYYLVLIAFKLDAARSKYITMRMVFIGILFTYQITYQGHWAAASALSHFTFALHTL